MSNVQQQTRISVNDVKVMSKIKLLLSIMLDGAFYLSKI